MGGPPMPRRDSLKPPADAFVLRVRLAQQRIDSATRAEQPDRHRPGLAEYQNHLRLQLPALALERLDGPPGGLIPLAWRTRGRARVASYRPISALRSPATPPPRSRPTTLPRHATLLADTSSTPRGGITSASTRNSGSG